MKRALLLVSLAVLLMGADKPKETKAPPVVKATAKELLGNYGNEALGDDLYTGKTVEVTGRFGGVVKIGFRRKGGQRNVTF